MRPTRTAALGAALLVAAGVSAGHVQAQPSSEPAPPPDPSAHATPAEAAPPPGPKTTIDADGTYAVGTDLLPGTYSTAGPIPDGACYWKRVSGDELVDNALTKKPQVIQIAAGDTSFTTSDCQPWQLTNAPIPPQGSPTDILGQLGKLILTGPKGPPASGGQSEEPAPAEEPAPTEHLAPSGAAPGP